MVTRSTKTNHYQVVSNTRTTTTNAQGESVPVDEICIEFDHEITFKLPLPDKLSTMHLQTTLHVFSDPASGKIVRLMDHPKEELKEWSLPNVSLVAVAATTAFLPCGSCGSYGGVVGV